MKPIFTSTILASFLALTACDEGGKAADKPADKPAADKAATAEGADKADDEADDKAAEAPACDKVVDQIASFNEESGDPERKLWSKMCAEMTPAQRTCVATAKSMDEMKACMGDKGDEKLK